MEKHSKLIWILDTLIVSVFLYTIYLLGDGKHFLFPFYHNLKSVFPSLILLTALLFFKGFLHNEKITFFGFSPDSIYKSKLAVGIILGAILFVGKFPAFTTLPFSDSVGYIIPATQNVLDRNFDPITIPFWDIGHPPLLMELIALCWKIFGKSVWISHVPIFISAFISIYFLYLIGRHIYSPKIGFWASLLLLADPLFFSQSGQILMSIPLTAAITVCMWAFLSKRYVVYFITGSAAVLLKETGILIIPLLVLYQIFPLGEEKNPGKKVLDIFIAATPGLTFLAWIFYHYYRSGWLLFNPTFHREFFDWNLYPQQIKLYLSGLTLSEGAAWILTFFITFRVFIYIRNLRKLSEEKTRSFSETILLIVIVTGFIFMHALFSGYMLRYFLPVLGFYILLGTRSITGIMNSKSHLIILIALIASVAMWNQERGNLACSLKYMNMTRGHKEAIDYIKNNYPENTKILCDYFFRMAIVYKEGFYCPDKQFNSFRPTDSCADEWEIAVYNSIGHPDEPEMIKTKIIYSNARLKEKFVNGQVITEIYEK